MNPSEIFSSWIRGVSVAFEATEHPVSREDAVRGVSSVESMEEGASSAVRSMPEEIAHTAIKNLGWLNIEKMLDLQSVVSGARMLKKAFTSGVTKSIVAGIMVCALSAFPAAGNPSNTDLLRAEESLNRISRDYFEITGGRVQQIDGSCALYSIVNALSIASGTSVVDDETFYRIEAHATPAWIDASSAHLVMEKLSEFANAKVPGHIKDFPSIEEIDECLRKGGAIAASLSGDKVGHAVAIAEKQGDSYLIYDTNGTTFSMPLEVLEKRLRGALLISPDSPGFDDFLEGAESMKNLPDTPLGWDVNFALSETKAGIDALKDDASMLTTIGCLRRSVIGEDSVFVRMMDLSNADIAVETSRRDIEGIMMWILENPQEIERAREPLIKHLEEFHHLIEENKLELETFEGEQADGAFELLSAENMKREGFGFPAMILKGVAMQCDTVPEEVDAVLDNAIYGNRNFLTPEESETIYTLFAEREMMETATAFSR